MTLWFVRRLSPRSTSLRPARQPAGTRERLRRGRGECALEAVCQCCGPRLLRRRADRSSMRLRLRSLPRGPAPTRPGSRGRDPGGVRVRPSLSFSGIRYPGQVSWSTITPGPVCVVSPGGYTARRVGRVRKVVIDATATLNNPCPPQPPIRLPQHPDDLLGRKPAFASQRSDRPPRPIVPPGKRPR